MQAIQRWKASKDQERQMRIQNQEETEEAQNRERKAQRLAEQHKWVSWETEEKNKQKLFESFDTFTERVSVWKHLKICLLFALLQDWGGEDGGGKATWTVEGRKKTKRGRGRGAETDGGDSQEETGKGAFWEISAAVKSIHVFI